MITNTQASLTSERPTAVLPRLFGVLFYYSPTSTTVAQVLPVLSQITALFDENLNHEDCEYNRTLPDLFLKLQNVRPSIYDFSILFEGQGQMPAPPWGSVYLDKENLLMGESTRHYRHFLAEHEVKMTTGMNEPEDQFGLMLLALAYFMEQDNVLAANILLEVHLLPWAFRYLDCLEAAPVGEFYRLLGALVRIYLNNIMCDANLTVEPKKLYF